MSPARQHLVGGGLFCILATLVAFMQQRTQRRRILLIALLAFLAVELPFQLEEARYRHRRAALDKIKKSNATLKGRVKAAGLSWREFCAEKDPTKRYKMLIDGQKKRE